MLRKAIFLDRDGVINRDSDCVDTLEKFEMLPGTSEAIKLINDAGYLAIIISNQSVIAKGFATEEIVQEMHKKLGDFLSEKDAHIDAIYYCPHHPEKGHPNEIPNLKKNCNCRKPGTKLFDDAAKDHQISLKESVMIGDSEIDILAGKNQGMKTILVKTNQEYFKKCNIETKKEDSLLDAVRSIIKN